MRPATILGFRLSCEADLVSVLRVEEAYGQFSRIYLEEFHVANGILLKGQNTTDAPEGNSSRLYVGRHPILKRPWPHPNQMEMAQAYNMIARVQLEQHRLYEIKSWKPIIAITPTYLRTFQSLHLAGLMCTLSLVRGPVTWIVIEAGGISAETVELLKLARVHKLVHLGASAHLPRSLQDRRILDSHLRVEGLRYVREQNLEGVVVFADVGNVYSMQFFNEIQKISWVGSVPVGILGHAGFEDPALSRHRDSLTESGVRVPSRRVVASPQAMLAFRNGVVQVQGPACDSFGNITGWHAIGSLSLDDELMKTNSAEETNLVWAGFVLNARAVWVSDPDRPKWIQEWIKWACAEEGVYIDWRSLLRDEAKVETLGPCRSDKEVFVWWARIEAHSDSKYPSRWDLDSPPEVVVPAKKTPWPDKVLSPSSQLPPVGKRRDGNRSDGRDGRTRQSQRRPHSVKGKTLGNQRETIATKNT